MDMDDKRTQMVSLRLPLDVVQDLDAVCAGELTRTQFIVAALREALKGEEAAQRAREDRKEVEAFKRRIAEARQRAEAIGEALDWDKERIETFIAMSPSGTDGLLVRELVAMRQERGGG